MKFKNLFFTALLTLFAMLSPLTMSAQSVIFPQEKQPGAASVSVNENVYTLSNDLFSAKFIKEDGKLMFNGCEELGLLAGTELFRVKLADGTEIPASEFNLVEVETETLAADPNAVKGSKRFAGVQINANFTHTSGLNIEWHAVLRDGSHYLRTEAVITTANDIAMYSITPMIYTVQNAEGEKAPAVIGNTRGAVVASDKIFAGLETPTAFNTAGGDSDYDSFVLDEWSGDSSWAWTPGEDDIPQGIKDLNSYATNKVKGSRGYLVFREAGDQVITFDYTSGNNRLQVLGVDVLDLSGNVVDSDYHFGFTGGSDSNRDYTVTLSSSGAYLVRYFVTDNGTGEGYSSVGTITYSKKVKQPELVYDLASTETPYVYPEVSEPAEEEESPETVGTLNAESTSVTDNWVSAWTGFSDWSGTLPSGTTKTGTAKYKDTGYYNMETGRLDILFDYTGGSHGLYVLGVQVLDACNNVIAQEFKNGFTGSSSEVTYNVYVPETGIYRLRYITDYCNGGTNTNGSITIGFTAISNITGAQQQSFNWTSAWTGFAEWTDAPEGLKAYNNDNNSEVDPTSIQYIDKSYCIKHGHLSVLYDYTGGSHGLHPMGVVLMDMEGNAVDSDYHAGFTGGRDINNTYTVDVPESGFYTVRFVVDKNSGGTNTNGTVTVSLAEISVLGNIAEDGTITDNWTPERWADIDDSKVPARIVEAGCLATNARVIEQQLTIGTAGTLSIEFVYSSGSQRLDIAGVDLLDKDGNTVVNHYQAGYAGNPSNNNTYKMEVTPGTYTLRYFANNAITINSSGTINIGLKVDYTVHLYAMATTPVEGMWLRNTTLPVGENWKVSSVVGVVAPGQLRRSFLAYSERERAVPWRTFPHYNSWYELNINRNNAAPGSEHTNFTAEDILGVMEQWKEKYYDRFGEGIVAFVIDDGWDNYGPWTFHSGFPNEMRDMASLAKEMGAGIGAWLGPVGGYGQSGNYRRAYWDAENRGGMLLSNPAYYTAFKAAAENLVCEQDGVEGLNLDTDNYVFFKFDGISSLFSATAPAATATGNEDAEGIIRLERYVREELREDIFFNTTVGTWASPFWYQISDATWRQENDHDRAGNNSINRENWITYRDRLVYQNYVQNSPICPINTLMTHGFILSEYGPPASDSRDYNAVLRELRCAFACGSGIVELYTDCDLLNSIQDNEGNAGALWEDIAECVAWQKKNADVLPDAHWVGGNPWTGSKAEIYGWASWNGAKATFTLRNGANDAQSIKLTLREALDIPEYINTTITLSHAFADQANVAGFSGLTVGTPIDIDTELTITLPGSSLFVFDGADGSVVTGEVATKKYYRFKNVDKYLAAGGRVLSSKADADATTIFYLNEENELLSYSNGLYLSKANGFEAIGHEGNAVSFKRGSEEGTYTINLLGADWTLEEVTSLPVRITSAGYATLFAPVALALPEGVTAHAVTLNGETGNATLSASLETIPANTGVVLAGKEGTYNLAVAENGSAGTNRLEGTVEAAYITDNAYVLGIVDGEVGFYKAAKNQLGETAFLNNSHKAYLPESEVPNGAIAFYGFELEGSTAIEEVEFENENVKTIYDLQGRKVENPGKGLYIINGEKVFVK